VSAGVATIVIAVLIVLALVYFLVSTIVALRRITAGLDVVIGHVGGILAKTAPIDEVVAAINGQLDAGVELLEGLLVKKAGLADAVGLVDGLYPGAAAAGLRAFPESTTIEAPRIAEVYTRGTLTLARLGREAPVAQANPDGPAIRNATAASHSAYVLYDDVRHTAPSALPRSPVIGADAPVQYEQRDDIGKPRKRLPAGR
jgi:hypothetical protein